MRAILQFWYLINSVKWNLIKKHAYTHAYILKALPSLISTEIHWNGCIIETNTEWANIWWFVRLRHSAHPFHRHISNRVKPWTGCVIVWIFSDLCAYIGNTDLVYIDGSIIHSVFKRITIDITRKSLQFQMILWKTFEWSPLRTLVKIQRKKKLIHKKNTTAITKTDRSFKNWYL